MKNEELEGVKYELEVTLEALLAVKGTPKHYLQKRATKILEEAYKEMDFWIERYEGRR